MPNPVLRKLLNQTPQHTVLLFNLCNAIVNERLVDELKPYGITPREGWIMMAVADEPLSQTVIAASLNINPNVMVRCVDDVEKKGLVRRVACDNRRLKLLELTPKGRVTLKKLYAEWAERTRRLFHPATTEELHSYRRVAKQIILDYYEEKKRGPARRLTP